MKYLYLPFTDYVRSMGLKTYLVQIMVHDPLSALILFLVMNPIFAQSWNWTLLAASHVYFIPYFSILAAIGSFENEHFTGVSEELCQKPQISWLTRVPFVLAQTILPVLFFSTLVINFLSHGLIHFTFLILYWILFSTLGVLFVINWGFRKEKSINNVLSLIPWVLALGPGPFLESKNYPWFVIFPGSGLKGGHYGQEMVKLLVVCVLLVLLWSRASSPRRQRVFRLG